MSLRWLWFDHVPPELDVPKEARGIVAMRVGRFYDADERVPIPKWPFLLLLPGVLVWLPAFVWTEQVLGDRWLRNTTFAIAAASLVIGIPAFFIIYARRYAWAALCHLGYLCCVKCGYVHTGLSKDVKECPECGTAREFGKCVHCNSPQDWAMEPDDRCTDCGRRRLWRPPP